MLDTVKKRNLVWNCRRGMLELDLLLQAFLKKKLNSLTTAECTDLESLLSNNDSQLYCWLMGHEQPKKELIEIVNCIRSCH